MSRASFAPTCTDSPTIGKVFGAHPNLELRPLTIIAGPPGAGKEQLIRDLHNLLNEGPDSHLGLDIMEDGQRLRAQAGNLPDGWRRSCYLADGANADFTPTGQIRNRPDDGIQVRDPGPQGEHLINYLADMPTCELQELCEHLREPFGLERLVFLRLGGKIGMEWETTYSDRLPLTRVPVCALRALWLLAVAFSHHRLKLFIGVENGQTSRGLCMLMKAFRTATVMGQIVVVTHDPRLIPAPGELLLLENERATWADSLPSEEQWNRPALLRRCHL